MSQAEQQQVVEINTLKDFLNEFNKQISSSDSHYQHITYTVAPNLIARICRGRLDHQS